MIPLLPAYHETIVSPRPAEEVYHLIAGATSDKPFLQPDEESLFFNGWVMKDHFRISLRIRRANHYMPLVTGQVESTSSGSILFIDYRLLPTTRWLLILWTILLLLGIIVGFFQSGNIIFTAGGTGLIALIHAIVWSNFKLQLAPTREALHQVVSQHP